MDLTTTLDSTKHRHIPVHIYCEQLFFRLRPHSQVDDLARTLTTEVSLALSTQQSLRSGKHPFTLLIACQHKGQTFL